MRAFALIRYVASFVLLTVILEIPSHQSAFSVSGHLSHFVDNKIYDSSPSEKATNKTQSFFIHFQVTSCNFHTRMTSYHNLLEEHLGSAIEMKFDLEEAKGSLNALSLASNIFGDYMVVMESEISIILSEEPYVAFMLLFNVKTGKYFARIWNQTVVSGKVNSVKELYEACDAFFWRGRPCLGCPVPDSEDCASNEFIIFQTPIKRKYSNACQKVLVVVEASDVRTCSECLKLMDFKCETVTENNEDGEDIFSYENVIQPVKNEDDKADILDILAEDKPILKNHHKNQGKYPQIITEALSQAEDNMLCLKDIYKYIEDKHPYFGYNVPGWQNSIRHTLSVNRHFQNIPVPNKGVDGGKYGRVWTFTSATDSSIDDDDLHAQQPEEEHEEFKVIFEGDDRSDILQSDHPSIYNKPPLSYSQLIVQALRVETEKSRVLSLNEVCQLISHKHPYYDMEAKDWQLIIERLYKSKYKLDYIKMAKKSTQHGKMAKKKLKGSPSSKVLKGDNKKKIRSKEKPPYTIAELISQAFEHSESKILSRKDVCTYIQKTYPYYTQRMKHWRAAVVENLTKSSIIKRMGSRKIGTSKCSLWKLIDGTEVECPKCLTFFQCEDEEYFNHMRNKHFYGKFKCPSGCDIKAEYAKELTDHMEQEEHQEGLLVQCPLCEEYTSVKELEPHYATCLSAKIRKPITRQICPTCGKQVGKGSYDAHMKSHLAKEDIVQEEESNTIVYHYCEQCGKRYEHKYNLNSHIKAEHQGVLLQCPLCPKKFKSRSQRWQHKNIVHSTDDRYNCKYCGLRFGSESELRKHIPIHEVDSQYSCKHCGKKMAHKKSILEHEKIHTGEKPFVCPEENCGKRWISKGGLARHKRQVHKIGLDVQHRPRRKPNLSPNLAS